MKRKHLRFIVYNTMFLLFICFIILITYNVGKVTNEKDMIINTVSNTYHVKGLTIRSTKNNLIHNFPSKESLIDFINYTTIEDNRDAFECLYPDYPPDDVNIDSLNIKDDLVNIHHTK